MVSEKILWDRKDIEFIKIIFSIHYENANLEQKEEVFLIVERTLSEIVKKGMDTKEAGSRYQLSNPLL